MGKMKDIAMQAQDEGAQAYYEGKSPSDNPYSDKGLANWWYDGYDQAAEIEVEVLDRMAEEEAAFRAYEDGVKAF